MARGKPVTRTIAPLTRPLPLASTPEPGRRALCLRPFGYLLVFGLWLVLFALVLFVAIFLLPVALQGATGDGGLHAAPGFNRSDSGAAFVAIPIAGAVIGWISYFLIVGSLGNLLAAITLFVRSLQPGFRREGLSMSIRSVGGEAAGSPATAATGVSLSLLPVRLTRWSKIVMIIQFNGWIINAGTFAIGTLWGVLYVFTVGWVLWPATGTGFVLCALGSVVLAVVTAWLIWRRRSVFPTVMPGALKDSAYRWSWPNKSAPTATRDPKTFPHRS